MIVGRWALAAPKGWMDSHYQILGEWVVTGVNLNLYDLSSPFDTEPSKIQLRSKVEYTPLDYDVT